MPAGRFDPDKEYQTWREWLEVIYQDLTRMTAYQQLWHGYRRLLTENPAIQSPGTFHLWLANTHATAQAVGIRREADTDSRVISLARLLQRIEQHPEVVSRERYVAFQGPGFEEQATKWFDELVTAGADYLPTSVAADDFKALRDKVEVVRIYVNKRVAHWDEAGPAQVPTYDDIDDVLSFLFSLYRKYHLLLTGAAMSDEVILQPWEGVFRRPWIREGPVSPQDADSRAIRRLAKLSDGAKDELLEVLNSTARVRADVIRQFYERPETRVLAEVLMDIEGDELLRDAIIRILTIMRGTAGLVPAAIASPSRASLWTRILSRLRRT